MRIWTVSCCYTALREFSKGEALVEFFAYVCDSFERYIYFNTNVDSETIILSSLSLSICTQCVLGHMHSHYAVSFSRCIRRVTSFYIDCSEILQSQKMSLRLKNSDLNDVNTTTQMYFPVSCAKLGCKQIALADRINTKYTLLLKKWLKLYLTRPKIVRSSWFVCCFFVFEKVWH